MKCNICKAEMSRHGGLRLDCGGDCLHCMAVAGDPSCIDSAVDLAAIYEAELLRVQELLFRGMSPATQKDTARAIEAVLLKNPKERT